MKDRDKHEGPTDLPDAAAQGESVVRHWLRPYVVVDLVPKHHVNILYFRIRNVGQMPAYNIRLSVDKPVAVGGTDLSELNLFARGIAVLGPRDELSFFFGGVIELFNKDDAILQFTVLVKYSGPGGQQYVEECRMDAELLRNLAVELSAADRVIQQLERIKKELERLADYADGLRLRELRLRVEEDAEPRDQAGAQD